MRNRDCRISPGTERLLQEHDGLPVLRVCSDLCGYLHHGIQPERLYRPFRAGAQRHQLSVPDRRAHSDHAQRGGGKEAEDRSAAVLPAHQPFRRGGGQVSGHAGGAAGADGHHGALSADSVPVRNRPPADGLRRADGLLPAGRVPSVHRPVRIVRDGKSGGRSGDYAGGHAGALLHERTGQLCLHRRVGISDGTDHCSSGAVSGAVSADEKRAGVHCGAGRGPVPLVQSGYQRFLRPVQRHHESAERVRPL